MSKQRNDFIAVVQQRLNAEHYSRILSDDEYKLIARALAYSVGPVDCACQIIANREDDDDARSEATWQARMGGDMSA